MKKIVFLILVFTLHFTPYTSHFLYADESSDIEGTDLWETDADIEQAYQNNEIDYNTYEQLLAIYEDKIDINTADIFLLQTLPGISQLHASRIINYRLQHGYYKNINELINPEILDEPTFDRIKIFITAILPEKVRTKGDILFKTKSNIEQDTTEEAQTTELVRFKLAKFGKYLRFGAIVEGDTRYEDYFVDQMGSITGSNFSRAYRLNRSYIGYENGPIVDTAYLGDFRAGFGQRLTFDTSGKSSPNGFYPNDTASSQSTITYYWTSKIKSKYPHATTSVKLKGFGMKIKGGTNNPFDISGFYSKAKKPLRVCIRHPDGEVRQWTLENMYEEELLGGNLNYKLFNRTDIFETSYFGTTFYTSKREKRLGGFINIDGYPPEEAFSGYGCDFKTGIKGFLVVGELSHVINWGDGLFVKTAKKMGALDVIVSYRNYDKEHYNPYANAYSKHSDSSKFPCRDEQGYYSELDYKPIKSMKIKFYIDQFKHSAKTEKDDITGEYYTVWETPTTDRTMYFRYNWNLPRGVKFQLDRKWADKDIYQNDDYSEKMSVKTNAQLKFKPSKRTDFVLKYTYTQDYYDTPSKYTPKDSISTRTGYQLSGNLKLSGELKFSDTDLRKSGKESRSYWLQLEDKLSKNTKFRIRYNNKYAWSSEEYEGEDVFSYTEPGYANSWEARLEYKW
ncbi:MAG: helix-hairpin-helix domain-containing protein [Elusimicrobiota bacterium]